MTTTPFNRRLGHSQQYARMTIAPENMPPVPSPAIALPTMRATLLGATPHTRELRDVSALCFREGKENDGPKFEDADGRQEGPFDLDT